MQIDKIPDELKARPQWVVWRSIVDGGKVTKPPYQPHAPQYLANVNRPETWGTFDAAVKAWRDNPSLVAGIGFMFTDADEYFGIDLDDESKVAPEHLPMRREFVNQLLASVNTYAEISPSGKGLHLIGRGRVPAAGRRSPHLQIEVYGAERYFTMTGNVLDGRAEITDQQQFVDWVFAAFAPKQTDLVGDIDAHRQNDLTDEEVVRLATNYHAQFAPRFNAQADCGPGDWSDTFMMVVGIIERFTGRVEQVERIIMNSPMVLHAPPSSAGETRVAKAQRNFRHVLARVRQGNNGLLRFAEHGRQQYENMCRTREARARATADEIRKQAEEAVSAMSAGSASLLNAFPQLGQEHLVLTRPPGVVGEFVQATERGMFHPFAKFAIPATLAALAGVVARGYKLSSGSGLNLNFILAAPSGSGKTQTMETWKEFMSTASRSIENTLSGPSRIRIIAASTSSIQGIFEDFMALPSAVWMIEECKSQLSAMSDPKSNVDSQLRDAYNELFDASRHGKPFSPPRSVANRKANIEPIENLSISTYWTTTESKFDVFGADALDGFLSRVVVIRHKGSGGDIVPPWQVVRRLPDELNQILVDRLAAAKRLDETYEMSAIEAGKLITVVSTDGVEQLAWEMMQIAERIKNASHNGTLDPAYTGVSRVPVAAMRLAAILAVMESPYAPSVTREQYCWAFGYLLQNLAALLNDMDKGELGEGATDEMLAIVRGVKALLKDPAHKGAAGIPRNVLREHVKRRKPFSTSSASSFAGVGKRVTDALDLMVKEGMLEIVTAPSGTRGRPPELLCPTDDPIWRV